MQKIKFLLKFLIKIGLLVNIEIRAPCNTALFEHILVHMFTSMFVPVKKKSSSFLTCSVHFVVSSYFLAFLFN